MRQKLNIITLGVKDFQKSLDFYKNRLGWKTSSASQNNIVFFPMDGIVFALYPYELLAEDAKVSAQGSGFHGFTLAYNAKNEEEVEKVLKEAEEAGATIMKKAQKVFWGGYSGYFADPDGYLWEVAYNPYFQFDEKDILILP